MSYKILTEKKEIENFLQKDIPQHIYSIGDLDDFFGKILLGMVDLILQKKKLNQ